MADKKIFICVTPCFHNGSRYRRGDEFREPEENLPFRYKKDKNGFAKDEKGNMVKEIAHFVEAGNVPPPPPPGKAHIESKVNGQKRQ